jgi:hypothetical protein
MSGYSQDPEREEEEVSKGFLGTVKAFQIWAKRI